MEQNTETRLRQLAKEYAGCVQHFSTIEKAPFGSRAHQEMLASYRAMLRTSEVDEELKTILGDGCMNDGRFNVIAAVRRGDEETAVLRYRELVAA
jgi:hypothetical protein